MYISRNLAVAIINADFSGLEDSELKQIAHFLENVPLFTVTDWKEESNDINAKCSITRQWDHCVEIEALKGE